MSIRVIQRVLDVVMVICWFFWYMMSRQPIGKIVLSKNKKNKILKAVPSSFNVHVTIH